MISINLFSKLFLIFSIIFIINKEPSYAINESRKIISTTEIGVGVTHTNEVIYNFMNKNLNHQNINYIEMDLNLINSTYSLMCHKSQDLTTGKATLTNQVLSEQQKRKNIIGAINGDFFNMTSGIPTCNNVIDEEIFSTSITRDEEIIRPSFAILENNVIDIDNYYFKGNINLIGEDSSKTQIKIDSINRNDYIEDTINVFNHKVNECSTIYLPKDREDGLIILITPKNSNTSFHNNKLIKGKITNIINDPSNTYKISNNEIAIITYGKNKYSFLKTFVGMDVELHFQISKYLTQTPKIKHLLTGHEFLIYNNEIPDNKYFSSTWNESSINSKNYRTAIALTKRNTLIILTIDKKGIFKGMSLPELGEFLKSKDSYKAINLDGGGSTSMMIRSLGIHSLRNINLSKEDRCISNSIMITNLLPYTTNIKDFYFEDSPKIQRSEHRRLNFIAYDMNLNPIDIYVLPNVKFSSDIGNFDENGLFYPIGIPCKGSITVQIGELIKTYNIEII